MRKGTGRKPLWASNRANPVIALGRFIRRKPLGALALAVILFAAAVAAFPDAFAPYDPVATRVGPRLQPPGPGFPMGTDNFGRDELSRVVYGTRVTLAVGVSSILLAVLAGTVIGIGSGFAGERIDLGVQRVIDAWAAFPPIVLALVMAAAARASLGTMIVAIAVAYTPHVARIARARTLELKEQEFIAAARAVGNSAWRIMWRHLLPNALPAVVVTATGYAGQAAVLEASLSYLGMGIPPPEPAWGRMIFEGARLYLETAPWLTIFPGLALSVVVLSFAVLGDALRDVFDPRERH